MSEAASSMPLGQHLEVIVVGCADQVLVGDAVQIYGGFQQLLKLGQVLCIMRFPQDLRKPAQSLGFPPVLCPPSSFRMEALVWTGRTDVYQRPQHGAAMVRDLDLKPEGPHPPL